jgi:hypothetical protein
LGDQTGAIVFFQVPSILRILWELAFWDLYYEHCSYFSMGSLARLFRESGFDVLDLWQDYDDQYLMIEARPRTGPAKPPLPQEDDMEELTGAVAYFTENCTSTQEKWQRELRAWKRQGRRVVLWGGGSKAVAFLTTLGIQNEVEYAVDINPHKHGTYLAGTGQKIVAPHFLKDYRPDTVIVMNPIYHDEIQRELAGMGLSPEIKTV